MLQVFEPGEEPGLPCGMLLGLYWFAWGGRHRRGHLRLQRGHGGVIQVKRRGGSDRPGGTGGLVDPSRAPHHPAGARDLLLPSGSPSGGPIPPGPVPERPNHHYLQELILPLG